MTSTPELDNPYEHGDPALDEECEGCGESALGCSCLDMDDD